jgi:hypothetical protein
MENIDKEEMFVFVAPDGSPQIMTMAPEYSMCLAVAQMLSEVKMSKSPTEMFKMGYEILPVRVTITQNGTADDAFNRAQQMLSQP